MSLEHLIVPESKEGLKTNYKPTMMEREPGTNPECF